MKQTILLLFAAITIASAASCSKTEQPDNDVQNLADRVIELCFDNSDATKIGLFNRTPQWEAGDKIWLSNGKNSEEVTLKAADIACNVAKIKTTLEGTLYAVYPASAQNGVNGKKIGFKIPTSTDGTFGNAHICVAEGTATLIFKNVVSILKFTVGEEKTINLSSDANISGEFKVTYGKNPSIEAGTAQSKGITVTSSSAGDKYVAVASGVAFNAFEFTAGKSATNWAYKKSTSSAMTSVNTIYSIGKVSDWTYVSDGSLWAKFTTGASTKVRFAKGNMYYDGSAYKFEARQFDFRHFNGKPGDAASFDGVITTTPSGTVGSFMWVKNSGTAKKPYDEEWGYSETNSTSDIFFTNATADTPNTSFTCNGATNFWRTLSGTEWDYLLNGRNQTVRYAKAKVKGVTGLVIFPDAYCGTAAGEGLAAVNDPSASYPETSMAEATWTAMESESCVFLPIAGYRSSAGISEVGVNGRYWSSTTNNTTRAFHLFIPNGNLMTTLYNRAYGFSVRPVTAAL